MFIILQERLIVVACLTITLCVLGGGELQGQCGIISISDPSLLANSDKSEHIPLFFYVYIDM